MRALVTGGAGFIGSHVVEALLDSGVEVHVLDNLHPAAHRERPGDLDPRAEVTWGDVRDAAVVERALDGVDAVSHQAAMVGLGQDLLDVEDYVAHNDLGTAVLLRTLTRRGFRGRMALASSMVVYGEGRYSCPRHGEVRPGPRAAPDLDTGRWEPPCPLCGEALAPAPVTEAAPVDPRSVYAATKLHQEHLCAAWARETGATVTALRYHNVYGPRMPRDTPYAGVASIFRSALAAGRAPRVFEDGGQLRDFVHVRDVADANVLALASESPPGAYNVATGRPRSVADMARALAAAAGEGAPGPEITGEYRLGDVRHVFASAQLAARRLRFRARVAFEEGMAEFASAGPRVAAQAGEPAALRMPELADGQAGPGGDRLDPRGADPRP